MTTTTTEIPENHESRPLLGLGSSDQVGLLPLSPHDHPDPQVMVWSEMEMQAIRRYASACVLAELERCAKICDALTDPKARYGDAEYSAGAEECARRIRGA